MQVGLRNLWDKQKTAPTGRDFFTIASFDPNVKEVTYNLVRKEGKALPTHTWSYICNLRGY